MLLKNLLKAAVRSILRNRLRSLLTALGIIIGVSAVIIMVAIGQGSEAQIEQQISALGTNVIIVFPGASRMHGVSRGAGTKNRLTVNNVKELKKECTLISAISPVVRAGAQVIGGGNNWNTSIEGVSTDYFTIRNWTCKYGRLFSDKDIRANKKVALLGNTVAQELFPGENPTGERIRIRNVPFTVIGVLQVKGQNAFGRDQDDVILAPYTTVLHRLKGGRYINMMIASSVSMDQIDAAQQQMTAVLREAHRLAPGEPDDFRIRNQAEITQAASQTSRVMTLLLGAVAGVSLIVGGIGIMNIMLVSVTERTREIGIRLSVGARSSDVLIQFLAEAVVLSLIGGTIGILLSFSVAFLMNQFTDLYTLINPGIVVLAVLFSGAVGVFFGYFPARKAANLNPIDALRYE